MRRIAPCRPTVSQPDRGTKIATDVAYRRFATPRRVFVVADCPGHERHAAEMAAAASTSDLAVLLVDVRKGLLARTRRHAAMISLLGVQRLVLAVNKMDLVVGDSRGADASLALEGHESAGHAALPSISRFLAGARSFIADSSTP